MPLVPDELMTRLHEANLQLHRAKAQLDGVEMFNTDESRAAAVALRSAEAEIEAVTLEINALLPPCPEPGSAAQAP